jgi:S1-C subfamily serine protease
MERAADSCVAIKAYADQTTRQFTLSTGVCFDSSKHIVTCSHGVHGMARFVIVGNNGEEIPAKLVGEDYEHDVAVIQPIVPSQLSVSVISSDIANEPVMGEPVAAIGNPGKISETITYGKIVGLHMKYYSTEDSSRHYDDTIESDAETHRGNSGGALVRLNGDILGMNCLGDSGYATVTLPWKYVLSYARAVI